MNSILTTPTPNLSQSLEFYEKLAFEHWEINGKNFVSDGKVVIEIDANHFARAGVKLYRKSWKESIQHLQKITAIKSLEGGYVLNDSNGVSIYLMDGALDLGYEIKDESRSLLGNSSGLSLEGITISDSYKIWKELGFKITMGGIDDSWMVTANEDGLAISFMGANTCPHLFFNPSMTYFNGAKNLEIIQQIRDLGLPIAEEITHFNKEGIVDNVILRDPGGFGFFVFSD